MEFWLSLYFHILWKDSLSEELLNTASNFELEMGVSSPFLDQKENPIMEDKLWAEQSKKTDR